MGLERLVARRLSEKEVTARIQAVLDDILPCGGLEEVVLFGSAARGEMTEASDIDMVLIFESPEQARAAAKALPVKRTRSVAFPVDLLYVDRATYEARARVGGVYFIAKNDGRVAYRKRDT